MKYYQDIPKRSELVVRALFTDFVFSSPLAAAKQF